LKTRRILAVGILIIIFISISTILLIPSIVNYLILATVPSNPNFSIPSGLEPKNVIPADFGGTNYSEIIFEKSPDRGKWLVPLSGAFPYIRAENVCDGFTKGYLRKYSTYTLQNETVVKGNHTHPLSDRVDNHKGNTKEYELENYSDLLSISKGKSSGWYIYEYEDDHKVSMSGNDTGQYYLEYYDKARLKGNYTLFIHVIEYHTPYNARDACAVLGREGYPKILINDVKVIGEESHGSALYVLPSDNILISIRGNSHAARDAMSKVIELYKKQ